MTPNRERARLQFMTWLRKRHPEIYAQALDRSGSTLDGLGQTFGPPAPTESGGSFWAKFTETVTGLGTTYLTLKNQRDAMQLNLERARQGLPPVDAGVTAPVIRTEIDLPPDVVNRISAEAGSNVNKILLFGGAALLAVLLLKRK